ARLANQAERTVLRPRAGKIDERPPVYAFPLERSRLGVPQLPPIGPRRPSASTLLVLHRGRLQSPCPFSYTSQILGFPPGFASRRLPGSSAKPTARWSPTLTGA